MNWVARVEKLLLKPLKAMGGKTWSHALGPGGRSLGGRFVLPGGTCLLLVTLHDLETSEPVFGMAEVHWVKPHCELERAFPSRNILSLPPEDQRRRHHPGRLHEGIPRLLKALRRALERGTPAGRYPQRRLCRKRPTPAVTAEDLRIYAPLMLEGTPVSRRVDDWREVHPVRLRQGPEWLWDQDYPEGPASLPAGAFPGPEREPGDPGQGLSWHRLYREFPRASGLLRLSRPIRVGGRAAVVTSLDPGFYWGADRQRRLVWLRQVGDEWQVEGEVDLREQAPLELLQQWTHTGLQADYTPSAQSPLAEVTVEDPEVVWQGPFDALYGYRLRVRTRDGREDTFQVVTSSHPYFQGLAHNLIVTNGAPAEEVLAVIEAAFA